MGGGINDREMGRGLQKTDIRTVSANHLKSSTSFSSIFFTLAVLKNLIGSTFILTPAQLELSFG